VAWGALALVLALGWCSQATAGAWTQPQGDFYLKLWDRSIIGSKAYDHEGEIVESPSYQDHQLNAYLEYGLLDELTLVLGGTPLGYAKVDKNSTAYMGPLHLGARYGVLRGAVPVSIQLDYGYASGLGKDTLYNESQGDLTGQVYTPSVENHHGEATVSVGYGFGFGGWAQGSLGARVNSNQDIDTAITAFSQFGYFISPDWIVELHAGLYRPLGQVEVTNIAGVGQTSYTGFGLGTSYKVAEHVGIAAGFEGVLQARSNAATPSLTLGIEFTP
jgi:hypothetical protein